jgi:peptidyl-prolyl cis-trans isomerase D
MTMLDRMRRHRNWLKWSLALVCLAFVIFYIPDFLSNPAAGTATPTGAVASVNGRDITADEFRRMYQAQIQAYRNAYGPNMSDQLLRQLGVDQMVLQQLVDERAAEVAAAALNITANDAEVRQRIMSIPAFRENSMFIGEQRYVQLLAMQRPPLTPKTFEESIRRAIIVEKLRSALTEWLSITDAEVDAEYKRRNDKVKLALVTMRNDSFKPDVTASDAEIAEHFERNKDSFKVPEKRKMKYVLLDLEAVRAKITIPPADVERAYTDAIDRFTTPEQLRASHILFRTEGKEEEQVRAAAEEVLKEARGGADFAELARKHSDDEATKPLGGDLDTFGRGRMVPEFDTAAFALQPGQISDVVKTPYGFHIIKVVEKTGGATKPIDEVRKQLVDQLTFERAQQQAETIAAQMAAQITKPADLDSVALARGLEVKDTEFFARDEPIPGLGLAPEVASRIFQMNAGEVAGPISSARGVVFATLLEKRDPYVPELAEATDKVRDAVVTEKAKELARQKAADVVAKAKSIPDFEKAAKAAGFEAKTTELITRDSPIPDLGLAPAVTEAAFSLGVGAVSDLLATDTGVAVVKVVEKQDVGETELAANRDRFREELLDDRRNRFFSAYMNKAKEKMQINMDREAVRTLTGQS